MHTSGGDTPSRPPDQAAQRIIHGISQHHGDLAAAERAWQQQRGIVKQGRIMSSMDSNLAEPTAIISEKDHPPIGKESNIPESRTREVIREGGISEKYVTERYPGGELAQTTHRSRLGNPGGWDTMVITEGKSGTSSVEIYNTMDGHSGILDPTKPHEATLRSPEGELRATFFPENQTRVDYLRTPEGVETVSETSVRRGRPISQDAQSDVSPVESSLPPTVSVKPMVRQKRPGLSP